jgi:hypothetical protein
VSVDVATAPQTGYAVGTALFAPLADAGVGRRLLGPMSRHRPGCDGRHGRTWTYQLAAGALMDEWAAKSLQHASTATRGTT